MLGKKLGIDLGTNTVRVVARGEPGMIIEPSVVALAGNGWECLGFGVRAGQIAGERRGVRLVRPLEGAVLGERAAAEALLAQVVARAVGLEDALTPDAVATVSPAMSGADRRALLDALCRAGTRTAYLVDTPLAAAIGAGLRVGVPDGVLVVDIGAGTVEAAVLAREARVAGITSHRAGAALTSAIAAAVASAVGVSLAVGAAEQVKLELAALPVALEERRLTVETQSGGAISVSSEMIAAEVEGWAHAVAMQVAAVLEDTPAPVLEVLRRSGGALTGAAARLPGLERYLSGAVGLQLRVATEPETATLRGCSAALDNLDMLKRNLLYIR
ncbi:MAG: rod shape-determining protein [Candidatus Dormibacteria bacterium]